MDNTSTGTQSQEKLTDKLLKSSKEEIRIYERNLSIPAVLQSGEPSLMVLRQERFEELVEFSTNVVTAYLGYCFPNQIAIAGLFAEDLIDQRPDWKAADFILCFKFIRTRQDLPELKVFGNAITPQRLNEMICVYEEHRSIEREKLHAERKGNKLHEGKVLNELGQEVAKKIAERTQDIKIEDYVVPDENYFKKKTA